MKKLIKRTISLALAFLLLFSGSGVLATPMKAHADEYEEAIGENEYQTVTGTDQDEYDYLPDEVSETAPVEQETTSPEYRNAPASDDQEPAVEETEVQEPTEEVPETTEEPAETESEAPAGETEEYVEETQIETEEEQPVTEEVTEEPTEETNQPEPENASAETTEPEEDPSDPAAETETELPEAPSENEDNDSEGSNTDEGQDEMTEDGAYVPNLIFLPAYTARGSGDGYKVVEGNWTAAYYKYVLRNFNGNTLWHRTDFPWMAASEDEYLQVGSDMWIYCYNFGTRTSNGTYVASSLSDDDRWNSYSTNIKMRMMLAWILGASNYGSINEYVATQWVIWEYSDFGRTSGTSTPTATFTMPNAPEITAIRNRILQEIDEAMVLPRLNTTSVSLNGIGSTYKQTITDSNNVLNKKNAANYTYWHVVPQDNTISATVNSSGKLEIYANKYFTGTKTVTLTRNDNSKKVEGGFAYTFLVEDQKAFLGQPEDEQKIVVNVTMQPKNNFRMYKVIVDHDGNEVTRDNPEGFALRVRNPALKQYFYARSNSSGEFYSTNSSYAAVESNQTKVFANAFTNGEEIEFYEDAAHSRDQSYEPRTATLHIKNASGTDVSVKNMSIVPRVSGGQVVGYYLTDGVNDTGSTVDHCFKIQGLQSGYWIAVKVNNRPTVKIRIKKATNTGTKEGFAFTWRSYQTDDSSTWFYGKSDSTGKVYKTNSSFATVTSNKVYDLEYIQDGFIALSEDIGHSQSTNYRPKKVTVVITDANGKVIDSDYGSGVVVRSSANNTWWITDGVADTNDTQGRDRYFHLSGLKAGYTVTFIVSNTTTSTFSAIKLDFSNTHTVAGIKFKLYKRSKTGTTWSHVADFTTTSVSDTSQTYSEYNESYAAKSKYDTRTYGTRYGKIDIPTSYLDDNYIYRLSEVLPSGYTGMAENWRDKPVYTDGGETVVRGEEFSPSDGSYVGVFTNDSKHNMTMSKTITSGYGGTVEGFAFRISCKSNGYYQYGISDASGNIYRTKASYTASNDASNYTPISNASSRVYTFDNLRNGYIAIMEDMNASTQHEFIPKSATVKVVDGNGTVKKTIRCSIVENNDDHRYYFTDGVAEDWDPEGRDRYLLIKELQPGYALTVAVENEPTYKLTLSKSVEGNGSLDGFAFRIYNKNTGTYEYFKTDEEGKAYRTTYEDGVFEDVPAADRKYGMECLKNGQQISILELMPYSTHSMYIPKSVKIKVYDANGTLKKTVNCSVTERNPTTHDRCYYFGDNVEETTGNDLYVALDNLNLKYGYNISIEVLNEPTHMLTIQKQVNNDTESKAGFAFRLYCTGNPTNEKYLWGVSDTDGRVFRTAASSTTADQSYVVPSTKTYDFELREGRVSILEDLPNSTHPNYIPSYATIRVYAEDGQLKRTIRRCKITPHGSKANCYYFGDNVAEDENGTDIWIDFQNLDPGDSIVISIGNDSLHTMTLRKSVDVASGHKDGFCFRIFSYGAGEYQWGKSDTDGRIFKTGVTSNTTADESFETPATKEYTFTGIRSGYLSILEKIPQSTYTKFIPTSATVRIYNEDGTQDGSDIVCSVVERNSETHDRCYYFVDGITDWNGDTDRYLYLDLKYGQTIDIELHNTSLHDMTIKKTVDGSGAVDGFAFRVYSVGEDFQWGKSAATTGNVFKTNTSPSYHADTAADYALENGTDYNFNIRNGLISVFENLHFSTYPNYVPVSATIKVMGENGQQKRVINCTVKKHATASNVWMFTDNLPDSSGSSTDNSMLIDDLEYGDNLVMEIHNEGIHTMTITKSVDGASNQVDGFAFQVHNQNRSTYIYGKSAETTGKVFVTSTSTSATPTATSYNTPSGTLSYQFDIKSGLISILEDVGNSTHSDYVPTAATIRVRDENGVQVGQAITATIKRSGSSNTYYITDGVNESGSTDQYFDFSNLGYGQTIDVQLTNSKLLSLDITKQVLGQMGSRNQAFRFVLSTTPPNASMAGMSCAVTKTTASGSTSSLTPLTLGQDYTFTLKSGENVHVDGLPAGTTYSIIESPSGSNQGYEGYTTSWKVGSTSAGTGASLSAKTLSASTTVTVTNSCGTTPPTGVFDNSLPVIMLTATMLLSAAVLLEAQRRKRKNAENQ